MEKRWQNPQYDKIKLVYERDISISQYFMIVYSVVSKDLLQKWSGID